MLGEAATGAVAAIAAIAPGFWLGLVFGDQYIGHGYLLQWWAVTYVVVFLSCPLDSGLRAVADARWAIGKVRAAAVRLPDGKAKTQQAALQLLAYLLDLCLDRLEANRGRDMGLAGRLYGALINQFDQWNEA